MTVSPLAAVSGLASVIPPAPALPAAAPASSGAFARMLLDGVSQVDAKLAQGEAMAARFAVDDSIPVHQVTFALEQARLSFELAMQVRSRLVDAFQELTRMQL